MKPANVAKLCMQGSDFYADAMKLMQLDTLRPLWPKVRHSPFSSVVHVALIKRNRAGYATTRQHLTHLFIATFDNKVALLSYVYALR